MVMVLFYIQYILLYQTFKHNLTITVWNVISHAWNDCLRTFCISKAVNKSIIIKVVYGARCPIHKISQDRDDEKLRRSQAGSRHYLGCHKQCNSLWCKSVGNGNKQSLDELPGNVIFELDRSGDWLISKASQPIDDQTINIPECYMSISQHYTHGGQNSIRHIQT